MKLIEYQDHLRRQDLPEDRIDQRMAIVRDFVTFLADPATGDIPATAGKEEARTLARRLVAEGRNTLAREAILQGHQISRAICHCSLGFASHYLAGLGREFKGEVLESAVKGDTRCRFVFHLGQKKDGTTSLDPTARRPSDAAPRNQSTA